LFVTSILIETRFEESFDLISIYLLILRIVRRKHGSLVPLEISILSAVAGLQEAGLHEFHGYQIAKHLADVADSRLLTAYGTLYRALGRLEKMGLLQSHWEDPQRAADENRPGRRLYALTGEGLAAAHAGRVDARAKSAALRRRGVAPA
jgi:PadR family transcriptional regulator PadR